MLEVQGPCTVCKQSKVFCCAVFDKNKQPLFGEWAKCRQCCDHNPPRLTIGSIIFGRVQGLGR